MKTIIIAISKEVSKVWNASNLNSGIYIYVLRSVSKKGVLIESKKMCLIK